MELSYKHSKAISKTIAQIAFEMGLSLLGTSKPILARKLKMLESQLMIIRFSKSKTSKVNRGFGP